MLLDRLRENIKSVLLGSSALMVCQKKKRLLESLLEENPYVICFFSCITTLSEGKPGKQERTIK